ncbi:uncharacterized protein LOC122392639 [Amphibalanus amphitrite]|uniref:uncharacterized protein LOC122392639 n=1 Tax=Amphibalanus amphitrite TaxID=1232801 RepID=UPI001C92613B|nr:uncharacterized protein LOC122392639 [Amphibalanus amphitrite]
MSHTGDLMSAGVVQLLDDLAALAENEDLADIVFLVGPQEERVFAHSLILKTRCRSFQRTDRKEVCQIAGSTVTTGSQGSLTVIKLPAYRPEVFKQVIIYIYTGRVSLSVDTAPELLAAAAALGLESLRQHCHQHIADSLSAANACALLAAAVRLQDATGSEDGSLIDKCLSYIGQRAAECVQTAGFLNLPRKAMIRLISSEQLALDEESVWRAVLAWAKHGAGVTRPAPQWSDEERTRVCAHMSGVINHVKLLLIDSQVFADEVEPTGVVPMELSLERYRFAALPDKFRRERVAEDRRLQPRLSGHLFTGSRLLTGPSAGRLQQLLSQWYGDTGQRWRLLYRASDHDHSAQEFHRLCDGVAPTFTLCLGESGQLCGGFSDVAWVQSGARGRYIHSDSAFLFTLVNHQNVPPTRFPVKKRMYAICYHPQCGPIFGAGADLCISDRCDSTGESYSNLPHSYDGDGASSALLFGDYNFNVADYEVFTVA